MDREGMNQSLGYWITSLPRKSDDRQILHQVTPSSTPKYLVLLDKVLPSVAREAGIQHAGLMRWGLTSLKAV